MNKFDRVISTLVLLQTRRVLKASTISERFDVSLRTVYRDIATLKNAGIPISGDPGIGYSIMEGYRLPPIMFNEGEAAAMLTAEKFIGKVTDKATQVHYSNALTKIKAILRSTEKQSLAVLDDSIAFSADSALINTTYLQELFKSIGSKYVVAMQYQKADGTNSTRKVEPIGCYHQSSNWYLIAFCQSRKDYRTFKVDRIAELQLLDQHFDTKHIGLQDYIDRQDESWKEQQQFHLMEVSFNQTHVEFAEKRKYYFGFVEETEKEGVVHMKFLNSSIELMARWLLQFGDQATVTSPPALKIRIKDIANQLVTHYS
ncbi:MAG: helix-turn-helix transcriptional regulator [Saprospiraceae bacterium]